MNADDLGMSLRVLRNEKNKTQQQLADYLGVTRGAYSHFENGRNEPDTDTLVRLANYYDISVDALLGRTEVPNSVGISGVIPSGYTIPILGRIAASAPSGLVSDYEGEISIQPSTVRRYGRKDIFALRVLGDSMNRIVPEGSIAIIYKTCDWEDGDICAVTINGDDATLKQVSRTPRGIKFTPLSYSKFHAPWEYIENEDEVDVIIHGVFLYGIIPTDKM